MNGEQIKSEIKPILKEALYKLPWREFVDFRNVFLNTPRVVFSVDLEEHIGAAVLEVLRESLTKTQNKKEGKEKLNGEKT